MQNLKQGWTDFIVLFFPIPYTCYTTITHNDAKKKQTQDKGPTVNERIALDSTIPGE